MLHTKLNKSASKAMCIRNAITTTICCTKKSSTINDMPHPKSIPVLGTKLDFWLAGRGSKLHEYIDMRHNQLGCIFKEKMGNADIVFVSDPSLMKTLFLNLEGKYPAHILPEPWILYEQLYGSKRGLFFMDGDEWLQNRRYMNKLLLKENAVEWIKSPIKETIAKFITNWKSKTVDKEVAHDLDTEFYKLSIDVIIAVLLGTTKTQKKSRHHDELLNVFAETVKRIFYTTTKLYGLPTIWCQRLNLNVWKDFKDSVDKSLLLANKIVSEILKNKHESNGLIRKMSEENIPDELIKRIVADFVMAAGDTTSYTSIWTLYLLSKNQAFIKDLRQNISNEKDVLKESMRLYPVAPFLTRILQKDSILGQYKLNSGTPIVASIYTSGRDEEYFSQADRFLPYRWNREDPRKLELTNHMPSASLPFALGARSCIGKKIAMIQLTEVIKQIVDNFDFRSPEDGNVKAVTSQVLVPEKPIKLLFTTRNQNTLL